MKDRKYIIITGGVISGLGKGVTLASIGYFFSQEKRVIPIKLDGYLNIDPGTMNPIEHGEVFVLDDGSEVDMDFGHYERFLNIVCHKEQSITMGKIYESVMEKERVGDYLGRTVQLIPHVTDNIKEKIKQIAEKSKAEIVLVEIGGTIGDLENELFVEALRQLKKDVGDDNVCYLHLSYVPIPYGVDEQKTKPTQQSVNLLKSKGIWPDFIICRSSKMLLEKNKKKIALFANLEKDDVFTAIDIDSIYKVPGVLESQGLIKKISKKLKIKTPSNKKLKNWEKLLSSKKEKSIIVTIAGKYVGLEDSYASVVEALKHVEANFNVKINIKWLDTSKEIDYELLSKSNAVIVPGGFGTRGVDGKIEVIKYVRESRIPFLGICYGLQLAVIEFARNKCGLKTATSLELNEKTKTPIITLMDEQKNIVKKGGTMRLGAYNAKLKKGIVFDLYKNFDLVDKDGIVSERHRHRYEVNPKYVKILEENNMIISGKNPKRDLVEFIELPKTEHPYFVATQAHPELKSKLEKPAPLFYGLIKAGIENYENKD